MLLKIDFESEEPIYTQLRHQIVYAIATGNLAEGESLPSVRQLAADLGINMHTVNKTYAILRSEGLLAVHKREGAIVRRREEIAVSDDFVRRLAKELEPIAAEVVCRSMTKADFIQVCSDVYQSITGGR